jgi:hypothetical protein
VLFHFYYPDQRRIASVVETWQRIRLKAYHPTEYPVTCSAQATLRSKILSLSKMFCRRIPRRSFLGELYRRHRKVNSAAEGSKLSYIQRVAHNHKPAGCRLAQNRVARWRPRPPGRPKLFILLQHHIGNNGSRWVLRQRAVRFRNKRVPALYRDSITESHHSTPYRISKAPGHIGRPRAAVRAGRFR